MSAPEALDTASARRDGPPPGAGPLLPPGHAVGPDGRTSAAGTDPAGGPAFSNPAGTGPAGGEHTAHGGGGDPLRTAQEAAVEAALARLDLPTKISLLAGQDAWTLPGVPGIGLVSLVMSDGPIGVRGTRWTAADPSIALPSPTALAATWDPALARRAGRLLGQEARRKGVHLLLAPTVNLHRSPLGGRHFEAYSEDPLLTGAIGTGYVQGVQDQGVGVTVKHFVANDFETARDHTSVRISERALRELYLAPFETIVAAAAPWGVMSAYNGVNGVTMSDHRALLRGVLKDEWGFDGVVVSDWHAAHHTVEAANSGLDVVMPGDGNPWGARLLAAVRGGAVAPEVIDDKVRRVLRLAARTGALRGAPESVPPARRPEPADGPALAAELATRSFVLAENRGGVLPLDAAATPRIALLGALADHARVMGGGSATVYPQRIVSPREGLAEALPPGASLTYAVGADPRGKLAPASGPAWTGLRACLRDADGVACFDAPVPAAAGVWIDPPDGLDRAAIASVEISGRLTAAASGVHVLGLRGAGRFTLTASEETLFDGEIRPDVDDHAAGLLAPPEHRADLRIDAGVSVDVSLVKHIDSPRDLLLAPLALGYAPPGPTGEELLAEAERVAAAADVAIVVVGTTDEVESEGFDRHSLALPGLQDELVRRVAAANPRTIAVVNAGSPVELPWAGDVAAVLLVWFPGQEAGRALARVLLGEAEPGGRLPTTWPVRQADAPVIDVTPHGGELAYGEGVFVGYRAWDRAVAAGGPAPRWAFGHGGGYTSWAYEQIIADLARVSVTVRNTGKRAGREVVQVYVSPTEPDPQRPQRWLAGFATAAAGPGEAVTIPIELPERTYQVWDGGPEGGWRTVPGSYTVVAARSAAEPRLTATVTVA